MMSGIKRFRVDLHPKQAEDLAEKYWQGAEREMCRQFDEWEEAACRVILAVNFGGRTGRSLDPDECSHYVYMTVFYKTG